MKLKAISWQEWIERGEWRESSRDAMPMLPALVPEVMALVTDQDISILRIARIISKEQVLATRVLRLANSAYFAPASEVTTIGDAIVRMGTSAVRNVVLAVCFASWRANDVHGMQRRQLADHSVGTAYLARLVAERAGIDPDESFLHGLLHDIGKLLLAQLADDFVRAGGTLPPEAEVQELVANRHAALGAEILARWELPARLHEPVRFHHTPEDAGTFEREAEVTSLANRLSHRYGFGCPADGPDDTERLLADDLAIRLGVTAGWLDETDQRAPGLFAIARQIVS